MIYLDVTSACLSPLNTGVKRMQRAMHESLKVRKDYTPICWQGARRAYRTLRENDFENLEQIRQPEGTALYDSFARGAVSDWVHFLGDGKRVVNFFKDARPVDMLLMPDLLWDNRAAHLKKLWTTGLRRVAIFHDAIALRRPRQSRLDRHFCARGVRALAAMDKVLCISEEAEHDLYRYWGKFKCFPTSTGVVPWPVPFEGPRPVSQPRFAAKKLLYVARLEPHKNHLRLLEACEKLWTAGLPFELRLIGCKAYPTTAWKIQRQVEALQRKGRQIRWEAHVAEPDLRTAYGECSFTVFPSLIEGFGLPIIESLWYGRPVVCGDNGALGEIASGGGCEIVDTESVENLADGMQTLLVNEARYRQLWEETQRRSFRNWGDYWGEVKNALG